MARDRLQQQARKSTYNPLFVMIDRVDLAVADEKQLFTLRNAVDRRRATADPSHVIDLVIGEVHPEIAELPEESYLIPLFQTYGEAQTYLQITQRALRDGTSRFIVREEEQDVPLLYEIGPSRPNEIYTAPIRTTDEETMDGFLEEHELAKIRSYDCYVI